jgi:Uma2 family endonuclease
MAPSGGETSRKNARIIAELIRWADVHGGIVLDSSGGFRLPNGAIRSPDVAWFASNRWEAMPLAEREGFPALVPDFVIELVSPSDTLARQVSKMQEYAANGVKLGWLLVPATREIQVYRAGHATPRIYLQPCRLAADADVLPEFSLDLTSIW